VQGPCFVDFEYMTGSYGFFQTKRKFN